jgi:hypothetical protein
MIKQPFHIIDALPCPPTLAPLRQVMIRRKNRQLLPIQPFACLLNMGPRDESLTDRRLRLYARKRVS